MKTDYPLTMPDPRALSSLFGGARNAINATGGDVPLACYFINNPVVACAHGSNPPLADGSPLLSALRLLERTERDDAICRAWTDQPADKRRTVAEVMRQTGCGFYVCTKVLRERGCAHGHLRSAGAASGRTANEDEH